jgi:hypothetical protein
MLIRRSSAGPATEDPAEAVGRRHDRLGHEREAEARADHVREHRRVPRLARDERGEPGRPARGLDHRPVPGPGRERDEALVPQVAETDGRLAGEPVVAADEEQRARQSDARYPLTEKLEFGLISRSRE